MEDGAWVIPVGTGCETCHGTGRTVRFTSILAVLDEVLRLGLVSSNDHKIRVIQTVRKQFNLGLRDAKEAVEGATLFLKAIGYEQGHTDDTLFHDRLLG